MREEQGSGMAVPTRRQGIRDWQRWVPYAAVVWSLVYAALGMREEDLRRGQESGTWSAGLFLATFGLVGAALTLGLVQRWGEVFPRWMIGLAGRRVPIALAVVPASLVSVLLVVGGVVVWSHLGRMVATLAARGAGGTRIIWELVSAVGAVLLFPVWGTALAVATLGYYYRRRRPCSMCGRGASAGVKEAVIRCGFQANPGVNS